ncbi:thioredoxin family protein [Actinomadura sp. 9N215]|uniref:thioredoxin family protein n=1 Tax=Actinomadura sp. 9N215 TaxID=3375150 RepID=UPI00378DD048
MPAIRLPFVLAIVLAVTAATACGTVEPDGGVERAWAAPTTPPVSESPATPAASPKPLPRAYDPKADANAEVKAALAKAKQDRRPVLLDFGARWCPDCLLLEHTFRRRAVRPLLDGYHVVSIDVGRFDRRLGLARKYGLELAETGIPALVVLSPDGEVRTAGNQTLFATEDSGLVVKNVAPFLRRWQ